jgi:hypothetical protein
VSEEGIELAAIGRVESPLTDAATAPEQGDGVLPTLGLFSIRA